MMKKNGLLFLIGFVLSIFCQVSAEDGSRLWLRYEAVSEISSKFSGIIADANSLPVREFQRAWKQMSGSTLVHQTKLANRSLIVGTSQNKLIKSFVPSSELQHLGSDGYLLKTLFIHSDSVTVLAANTDAGLLYGTFHLLRLFQTGTFNFQLNIAEKPAYQLRILNHWDNLDGTVERGYAGHSIWKWDELPSKLSPRYEEYARANASIGINATVLNNVNASPKMLTNEYLQKVKAIAAVFRSYHIRIFLSINFSSPKEIGGLPTSDPLDKSVRKWWEDKVREIYALIPDFGGFLVKANSEGLPGPMDYGRTHVDGANMLADALRPFQGIVMWRAFVYEPGDDRVKLAYKEFYKFDGQFRDNVLIQVKNGPVDFQPREPFSPLFGAMKKTALMPEFQITQEYLGQGNHLVFLAPMWREFFDSETYAKGEGSTIARLTTGAIFPMKQTAIAGVANIGEDANWCGHHFAQANWYTFGRLAWNPNLSSDKIADEWITQTFRTESNQLSLANDQLSIKKMMLTLHETCVNYMMPLGLHHIFAWTHHYGPEPWCEIPGARPDWLPKYYHKADSVGLGADRTLTGTNAVSQYFSPLREQLNDLKKCPEKYLLWFHHVPWDYKMKNGRILWDELCFRYDEGVQQVRDYQKTWDRLEPIIDAQRFREVQLKLRIQAHDAVWWKDACLLYFQTFSKRPIPYEIERPVYELDSLKAIKLNMKHHN